MGFNLNKINNFMGDEKRMSMQNRPRDSYNFISPSSLDDGIYKIRILPPNPSKNPDGIETKTTHLITIDPDIKRKYFHCPKMYDDTAECLACDIAQTVFDEEAELSGLSAVTRQYAEECAPTDTLYLYITITAEKYKTAEGKEKFKQSTTTIPAIFNLAINHGVAKDLVKLMSENRQINDPFEGHNIEIAKAKNRYKVSAELKPTALEDMSFIEDSNYPDIKKMGAKNNNIGSVMAAAHIKKSIWYPEFEAWCNA